jgi:hypothetical protein
MRLIAAEAMRTTILLIGKLRKASCREKSYSSVGQSSIARESFGIRLWCGRVFKSIVQRLREPEVNQT